MKTYAGFWIRFCAGILNTLFMIPPFVILALYFGPADFHLANLVTPPAGDFFSFGTSNDRLLDILSYIVSIVYIGYFLASKNQATIGKRILGIYVGNPDGSKLSTAKSFSRAVTSLLTSATLGLGFLPVIFTTEKTALHDLICNTRVFYGKKND